MDYKKAVEDKKAEAGVTALQGRMDSDRELCELKKYTLTDVEGNDVPNAINVTLNDPAVFATNVEAALGNATEQVVVESEDKHLDTAYIEDFIRAAFASADARLGKRGKFPLNAFIDQQMCRRGRGAVRCLFWFDKKTKEFQTELTPWDTRYLYSAESLEGFKWMGFETTRSKDAIQALYPQVEKVEDEDIVLDAWDSEHNEVWVGENKVKEQRNMWGYPPVALQLVPIGSMLADKDSLAKQGESIFLLIRDLIPELNRLVSIIQSLNQKALDNALLWKSAAGPEATPPKYKALTRPGAVTSADLQGGVEPIVYGELKRSAYLLHTMIETRIQRGSLSNLDLGIMGNQPWSAIALIEIGEGRDQVFLPRLGARGLLKRQLAEMIIDQVTKSGLTSVEIGAVGHKKTFDVRKLQGQYDISFKYFVKSPKLDVARYSMAAAAGNMVPDRYKRRDIIQLEDPEDAERWLRWEEVERLVPTIKMRRGIKALLEMAERGDEDAEAEAKLAADVMGITVEQLFTGKSEQLPKAEEAQKPQPLVPLFAGGQSSAQKAANLQAEPREEE